MAFSNVQSVDSFANAGTHGIALSSVATANTLVLRLAIFNPTGLTAVIDSAGQTWILEEIESGSGDSVETWVLVNANSGTHTLSLSLYGDAVHAVMGEYTSSTTPHVVDKKNSNVVSSSTSLGTGSTGTLSTNVQIALGVMTHNGGAPSLTVDTGAGWIDRKTDTDNNNHQCISAVDFIASATTALQHTWAIGSPTPGEGIACIITLMESGGPPPALDQYDGFIGPEAIGDRRYRFELFQIWSPNFVALPLEGKFVDAPYFKSKDVVEYGISTVDPTIPAPPALTPLGSVVLPDIILRRVRHVEFGISRTDPLSGILPPMGLMSFPDQFFKATTPLESGLVVFAPIVLPPTVTDFGFVGPSILTRVRDYSEYPSVMGVPFNLIVTAPMMHSIIELYNLTIRLDVKQITDSGSAAAVSTDVSGTTVLFNKEFKDVESVVATTQEVADFVVVVDFVDVPNPTFFKAYVFNTAGVRVSKTIYWVARGIA